jgi:hypothetical protein
MTDTVLQAILPVRVHVKGSNNVVETYAFFDNGSTGCFITENVKDQLNAPSNETVLRLQTMHGISTVTSSAIDNLVLSDSNGHNSIEMPKMYTREDIPVNHDQIPKRRILKEWPHLMPIIDRIPEYKPSLEIGILIGSNCPEALQPLQVVPSSGRGPFAVRYQFGWTVNGPVHVKTDSNGVTCHRILISDIEHTTDGITADKISKLFTLDFSERDIGTVPGELGQSFEDRRFLSTVQENITTVDGHYQIPLPLKHENIDLPNNRQQAVSRANWQKRKMLNDKQYHEHYTAFVQKLLDKGYAYEVPQDELNNTSSWYLPHHGVYHPQKKKIRVVFDCSAKYKGIGLNDMLLQGPDLTNSLIGTLMRFRSEPVAFICDVEAMFYQVKVPPAQHNLLRFLWWPNGDLQQPLHEYKMAVHTFGAISSPSIANFALKDAANKADVKYGSSVGQTIRRNFYVDDCLKACADAATATQLLKDVTSALAEAGFRLTKVISNSKEVLSETPEEDRAVDCESWDLGHDTTTIRALGMLWELHTDTFRFSIGATNKAMTRRGLLSTVCSLYDPLGFLAPCILPAKKILQELCQLPELDWDEQIPPVFCKRWTNWLDDLPSLEKLSMQRCLKPNGFQCVESAHLHMFSDASSYGYGVAAYLVLYDGQTTHSSLVMGKSRLAPIKPATIPRLELTAATTAVKLAQQIRKEMDIEINQVVYHTDSTTVLHYIHSNSRRFPIFVTNRVQIIRDFSEPGQWNYVNTNENPADTASRGATADKMISDNLWFQGPSFLTCSIQRPPTSAQCPECHNEETTCTATKIESSSSEDGFGKLIARYSSWNKLKRAVVIFHRVLLILQKQNKTRITNSNVTSSEMKKAERAILAYTQRNSFGQDITGLNSSDGAVNKKSNIYRLDPFIDGQDGLLRVGGRIRRACVAIDAKHPILLPKQSHVTTLIIRDQHHSLGHAGRNHVLSSLRNKFWIINANACVRNVLYRCVICRKLREPVTTPKMADLPSDRVEQSPPFSNVGIDYFGPFIVKEGRKTMKRYGALFTCLVSRAVHIETAISLETDSFINALRRFIARRGPPQLIRSDNGTNFRGAERELRETVAKMDNPMIQNYLLRHNVNWTFNPPSASHMGGVWERQVRSIRKILSALVHEHAGRLNDESLRTLLCEVENIINSRPLTTLSDNVDDVEPLTPNHMLMPRAYYVLPPPGHFQKEDMYLRKRWRHVQYLANLFWSRWRTEYLSTLQIRQKWNTQKRNLEIGDIVLIKADNEMRNNWPMGRVIKAHPDSQGTVRSVRLKTQASEMDRPVHKLVLLVPNEQ